MSNYIGVKCPVCSKKFTQADDIVVCPICGAPHHRGCYARENECAFASDHLSGKEWRAPAPDPSQYAGAGSYTAAGANANAGESGGGYAACVMCHAKNPKGAIFCQTCGARMGYGPEAPYAPFLKIDPVTMVYGGLRPDEKIEDETARDLAVYVGPSSAYYLPRFKRLSASPYAVTFNLSAMFFGFFYFFYRKMYLIGGILLGLLVVSMVPEFLYMREFPMQFMYEFMPPSMHQLFGVVPDLTADQPRIEFYQQLISIASMMNLVISIMISFCSNRLYYLKASADVKRMRESQPEKHDEISYCNMLREKGGVSRPAVALAAAAYFIVYFIPSFYTLYSYLQMMPFGG